MYQPQPVTLGHPAVCGTVTVYPATIPGGRSRAERTELGRRLGTLYSFSMRDLIAWLKRNGYQDVAQQPH